MLGAPSPPGLGVFSHTLSLQKEGLLYFLEGGFPREMLAVPLHVFPSMSLFSGEWDNSGTQRGFGVADDRTALMCTEKICLHLPQPDLEGSGARRVQERFPFSPTLLGE